MTEDNPAPSGIARLFGDGRASAAAWLARAATLLYAFALPFAHNAAVKNAALLGMGVALVMTVREGRLKIDVRSPVILAAGTIVALALLSSVLGVDVAENLDAARKLFVPLLLLLPLAAVHFRRREALLVLLAALAAGFCLRSALSLYEMATTTREEGLFFKGYTTEATFYMPIVAGFAAFAARGWQRTLAFAALALGAAAVAMGETRTSIAAVALGCLVIPLFLGRWRQAALFVIAGALILGASLGAKPQLVDRYATVFHASTYAGPQGLSARYPIWAGVWQISQQKPILGYGFGWKKLGETAVNGGFVEKWKVSDDPYLQAAAEYFSQPTDKVNPHNLALLLLFETGFVGLAIYALVIISMAWQTLVLIRRAPPMWRPVVAMVAGFFVSYLVANLSNAVWLGTGSSAIVLALLEICRQNAAPTATTA